MQKFKTGAICWSNELISKSAIKGKYFFFSFEHQSKEIIKHGKELIISAKSKEKAQQAYELFIASLTLVDVENIERFDDLPLVYDIKLTFAEANQQNWFKRTVQFSVSGIYIAAQIAAKVSFSKKLYFSVYKYFLACNIHSNSIIDIEPFHSDYKKLTRNPLDHIRCAYAIQIFYSILEELQLEIRASNKKPSKINKLWNPNVKSDLETRLKKSGVNLDNKACWTLRSKPTKIQLSEKLIIKDKEKWARYEIRDSKIEIIDAINYLSWLRSKIIAHKFGDGLLSISIYDVANANFLIRQILFDILKIN